MGYYTHFLTINQRSIIVSNFMASKMLKLLLMADNIKWQDLRKKHPRFVYKSFAKKRDSRSVYLTFSYLIEPDLNFTSKVEIPFESSYKELNIDNLIFHLGLIEMINYWKATCSPEIVIEAGKLSQRQLDWWKNLILKGLGEFFFLNKIDYKIQGFISLKSSGPKYEKITTNKPDGDLIMIGGGRESVVTLELLKNLKKKEKGLVVNPIQASLNITEQAGYECLIARRQIDKRLFELNEKGYLNGHVPFSAFLAFLGNLTAVVNNYENTIVCNEKSAGEGNTFYLNEEINHQYSKTFEFEKSFREYFSKYLGETNYFSFLRPLNSLQVSKLFTKYKNHYGLFRSCNAGSNQNQWCGNCPKCASVYLSLFPFISYKEMVNIFKEDYFLKKNLRESFRALVGLDDHKPFECVGTIKESKTALKLSLNKYQKELGESPKMLTEIVNEVEKDGEIPTMLTSDLDSNHFLSNEYLQILTREWKR